VLQQLKADYADQNVLFIEQDVDAPLGDRLDRWFDSYNTAGDVYLPLVMIDSGHRISNGSEDFSHVYKGMVDDAFLRSAGAAMSVEGTLDGDVLSFEVELTNLSGTTFSAANDATLTALVWGEPAAAAAIPVVVAAATSPITTLDHGETGNFTFEVEVGGLEPDDTRWVVIADYVPPDSGRAYNTLQAVQGP
jgi:hypothetical protein